MRLFHLCTLSTSVILLALPPAARAAERHWSFTSACAAADWFAPSATGAPSCWSATAGGAAGAGLPTAADDARIVLASATATTSVPFAWASRGAPAVAVRSLLLQGSSSFAAGLTMDRGSLDVGDLALGLPNQAGRGLLALNGGAITAKRTLLRAGQFDLAGGSLLTGDLDLHSQGAGARLVLDAGRLQANQISLGTAQGFESTLLQQGGELDADGVTLGAFKGRVPVGWTVAGATARATVHGALAVGGAGAGALVLQGPARVDAGSVVVGQGIDGIGTLDMGAAGVLSTPTVTIGGAGQGRLIMSGGAKLDGVGTLVLGEQAGASGVLEATALQSSLGPPDLVIGRAGSGLLRLTQPVAKTSYSLWPAHLTLGELAGGEGTLVIERGILAAFLQMTVGLAGTGTLEVTDGAIGVNFGPLVIGQEAGAVGRVTLRGGNPGYSTMPAINIGSAGHGTLELLDGARLYSDKGVLTLGATAGGRANVRVSGAGSLLQVASVHASGPGRNRIEVLDGGEMRVLEQLLPGPATTILLDGGVLHMFSAALGTGTGLDWRSGTLGVSLAARMDDVQLPRHLALTAGRTLRVTSQGSLTLADGATLSLTDGVLVASALRLEAGARLEARGQRLVALTGLNGSWIQATGDLTLGRADRSDGFASAGVLWIGGTQTQLLDADAAELGLQTRITDGGRLTAAQGLWLPGGRALVGEGQARVVGALRSNGDVAAISGRLSFQDSVSGEGSWSGNLRFEGGFDPGARPVSRSFNGGTLEIAPGGWLRLDIASTEPRLGHDMLTEIGNLDFGGALRLDFAPGFSADQGGRLQLFEFSRFSGHLDAGNVSITGLPSWRVDLSQLAVDGSLGITPVPEPAAAWLLLAGGAVLVLRRRPLQPSRAG
jgi:T5SS/PEP-CTERM-associated repeat protein